MSDNVIGQHIQDCFVLLSITDTDFLRTARQCVHPSYFTSEITEKIIGLCYSYFDQFEQAPANHFHDEICRHLKDADEDEKELYIGYLNKINDMDLPSKTYVLSKISEFIKAREFQKGALQFAKLTEEGKFEEAEQLMTKVLKTGAQINDEALDYLAHDTPTYYNTDVGEELISTGIERFGNRIMLRRKQLVCILGGGKGKKSWWCQHLGAQGLLAGLRILYISHELSAEEIEMRYDMMFGTLVSREAYSDVEFVTTNEQGQVTDRETRNIDTVFNLEAVREGRRVIQRYGGKLLIKKYPPTVCSMGEMNRYLDALETFNGFVPDIIINDYPDIMKLPGGENTERRDKLNDIYLQHKRIADERNILMIIVSQTNRAGLEKARISKKDFAEDIRKLANVDLVLAVGQNRIMEQEHRMRVHVLGGRTEEDGFGCLVSQNIRIGQVVVDSWFERDGGEQNDS